MSSENVLNFMDTVKDTLTELAASALDAIEDDGRISVFEAMGLAASLGTAMMPLISAFKELETEDIRRLVEDLASSSLVLERRGDGSRIG